MLECTFYCSGVPSHTLNFCIPNQECFFMLIWSCHAVGYAICSHAMRLVMPYAAMLCGWLYHAVMPCCWLYHAVIPCGYASGCAVNGWWWQLAF